MKINFTRAQLQSHQKQIFKALLGILVLTGIVLFLVGQDPPVAIEAKAEPPLANLSHSLGDKNFWLFKAEHQLAEQTKMQETFKTEIETLKAMQAQQLSQIEAQKQVLEAQVQARLEAPQTLNNLSETSSDPQEEGRAQEASSSIFSEMISLSKEKSLPHIDHFIPAGTYVKAVLLNGLDISAGVSSQANPQPVLLRLIDLGSLPNHAKVKIKDCRLIAAAHGELSNERVNMRLEKLSCVQHDGQIIETEVTGFVNGLDGKNGVRGKVVLRDAEVLKRGFMGGLLSGLAKTSLAAKQPTAFGTMAPKGGMNFFRDAGSEGASDAFELMAKYNIQRAEQYQPVLQVPAGMEVDVVFHAGTAFGSAKKGTQTMSTNELSVETMSP